MSDLAVEMDWTAVFAARGLPDPAEMTPEEFARAAEQVARWPAADAAAATGPVLDAIRVATARALIAGSLRRGRADVGDVEIVCEARERPSKAWDGSGGAGGQMSMDEVARPTLEGALAGLVEVGRLAPRGKDGPRLKTFWIAVERCSLRLKLDLFVVRPPAQWGVILAIRTGPAEYSKMLVTRARRMGMRCEGGALWRESGEVVATPNEEDFLRALGLTWQLPEYRGVSVDRMEV